MSECELAIKSWQSHVELEFREEVVIEDIDMDTDELSAHELSHVVSCLELNRLTEYINNHMQLNGLTVFTIISMQLYGHLK